MYFCLSHCIYAMLYPTFPTYFCLVVLQPHQRKPSFQGAHLLLRTLLFVPELPLGTHHIPQRQLCWWVQRWTGNSTQNILPCTMAYTHWLVTNKQKIHIDSLLKDIFPMEMVIWPSHLYLVINCGLCLFHLMLDVQGLGI